MALTDDLHVDRIDHLIIEAGGDASDGRDRAPLLDHYRNRCGVHFRYEWRSKDELLWIADALSGAIHASLTDIDPRWFDQLCSSGVLDGGPKYTP